MASENPHVHVGFYPIITSIYVRFVQTYRSIKLIRYCIEKEVKEQIRNGKYSDDHGSHEMPLFQKYVLQSL